MLKVSFHCKDKVIEDYVTGKFGGLFDVVANNFKVEAIEEWMPKRLEIEARQQEWWDYEEAPDGSRRLKRDKDGNRILLIPSLIIERDTDHDEQPTNPDT